jgi:predicted DCC family thiol-disulfide oxidoreductase YuxK
MGSTWLVLYDSDCGFCKWLLAALLRRDGEGRLRPIALQSPEAEPLLAEMPEPERIASWHLISPEGERLSAGAAAAPVLGLVRGGPPLAALLGRIPRLTDRGYRWVAGHRSQLSRFVPGGAKARAAETVRAREAGPPLD